jgi:hypothetical protein
MCVQVEITEMKRGWVTQQLLALFMAGLSQRHLTEIYLLATLATRKADSCGAVLPVLKEQGPWGRAGVSMVTTIGCDNVSAITLFSVVSPDVSCVMSVM